MRQLAEQANWSDRRRLTKQRLRPFVWRGRSFGLLDMWVYGCTLDQTEKSSCRNAYELASGASVARGTSTISSAPTHYYEMLIVFWLSRMACYYNAK
ncbi:hypothetical protein EVAR_9625_1 [Eumeta japonica]|uniref:Uncharacterized protein n=1 Tax=Eumeta variegata TaxID=151549 RepID=A0A4C1TM97_EUMVA|nr:hypothetical protein EVAR_9625_1 [Eumeta japonica]